LKLIDSHSLPCLYCAPKFIFASLVRLAATARVGRSGGRGTVRRAGLAEASRGIGPGSRKGRTRAEGRAGDPLNGMRQANRGEPPIRPRLTAVRRIARVTLSGPGVRVLGRERNAVSNPDESSVDSREMSWPVWMRHDAGVFLGIDSGAISESRRPTRLTARWVFSLAGSSETFLNNRWAPVAKWLTRESAKLVHAGSIPARCSNLQPISTLRAEAPQGSTETGLGPASGPHRGDR
jgi:hypothetical protein